MKKKFISFLQSFGWFIGKYQKLFSRIEEKIRSYRNKKGKVNHAFKNISVYLFIYYCHNNDSRQFLKKNNERKLCTKIKAVFNMNKIVTKDKYQNQVLFNPPLNPAPLLSSLLLPILCKKHSYIHNIQNSNL